MYGINQGGLGLVSANYDLSYQGNNLTITKALLNVIADAKTKAPANFNEIRMEDKKGAEQLFIHAERNQDIEVENDETHWVGHDRTKTIRPTPRWSRLP